jgi:hypothetical protein
MNMGINMQSFLSRLRREWNFPLQIVIFFTVAIISLPFIGAGQDDTWIMLFAGEELGRSSWFTNHNGQLQEVSSSVLGALLAWASSNLAPAGSEYVTWKIIAWLPSLIAAVIFFRALASNINKVYAVCWVGVLCCIPQWHYWGWGGLESGLFWLLSLLLALTLTTHVNTPTPKTAVWLTILTIALPLTRADALWAPLLLLITPFLMRSAPFHLRFLPALIATGGLLLFHFIRYQYTGEWLPSPTYAKAGFSIENIQHGLSYLTEFHADSPLHITLALAIPLSGLATVRLLLSLIGIRNARPGLFEWAGTLVLIIDSTTVIVGGDWMTHHRFAIRSVLLKLVVLAQAMAWWITWLQKYNLPIWLKRAMAGCALIVVVSGWSAMGIVAREGSPARGTSINPNILPTTTIDEYFMQSNSPYLRDQTVLMPWIINELPTLVQHARDTKRLPLVVASYQAGFFPRELRKRYSIDEVLFIDIVGLTDFRIGKLPGARTPLGLSEGMFLWAESIALGRGSLGTLLRQCKPDAVYVLSATPDEQRLMQAGGYQLSYQKTMAANGTRGAIVFTAEPNLETRHCVLQ